MSDSKPSKVVPTGCRRLGLLDSHPKLERLYAVWEVVDRTLVLHGHPPTPKSLTLLALEISNQLAIRDSCSMSGPNKHIRDASRRQFPLT